jgi:hypothetical protein
MKLIMFEKKKINVIHIGFIINATITVIFKLTKRNQIIM